MAEELILKTLSVRIILVQQYGQGLCQDGAKAPV